MPATWADARSGGFRPSGSVAVANPLREQPFHSGRGRKARMFSPWIRHAPRAEVAEYYSVAGCAPMPESQPRKARLTAFEVLVEVDEERGGALTEAVDFLTIRLWVEEIVMGQEFLARGVTQNLRNLETGQRRADLVCNA